MRILLVAVLLAGACADDGVRHTPDATPHDGAVDSAPDAALSPAMLTISPGPTAFGDVVLGQASSSVTYTVTNSGELPSGTLGALLDSTTVGFALANNTCSGVTLQPHGTCTFDVGFSPVAAGSAMTTAHVSATPGGEVTADLTGNGLEPGALDIVEASHDFLTLAVDAAPRTHTFVVTNTGQVPTGVPMAQITGTVDSYAVMSTTCNSMLAPMATCNVVVKFDPLTVGSKPGSLVVTAQPGGSDGAMLAGVGMAHVAVTRAGNGTGTVSSNMTGIDCGSACGADFTATPVELTATPDTGATFTGWTGDCTGTGTCSLDLTAGKAVTATFTLQQFALTTSTTGNGSGTITASPTGGTYNYGTVVTLTPHPATGSTFTGWGGDCSGTGSCTVTMTQARNVTAAFTLQQFTLTTATNGTGSGTVAGGGTYDYGTMVTVTATPATGSTFAGWAGACTGTGACVVTMTQARSVTATFNLQSFTLTTGTAGNGSGTVSGGGTYNYGQQVTVTATPATGSTFAGWSGDCSGTGACVVTMTQARNVTATFTLQQFTLTTATAGNGSGTVSGGGTYNYGTQVTVTATPATGSTFTGWSGACTGTGACVVTMTSAKTVTATFTLQQFALTTSTAGNGSGTVSGAGTYNYGTQVTVTATPATGSTFTGWSGACTGTGPCVVTMTSAKSVTATFTLQQFALTTGTTGNGTGTVTGAGTYDYGTQVTVTASPATGSSFTGWGGDCSGTGACVVTMTQARNVTAAFTLQQFALTTGTAGNGSGTVSGAGTYNYGTVVTVTQSPGTGSTFTGWGGDCSGTGACQVTMTQARNVTAAFTLQQFALTTGTAGTGSGTVSGAGTYNYGTVVTVTATPSVGSVFAGWSGACTGTGACSVTMTSAKSVTATFNVQTFTLTTSTTGAGSGTVTGAGTYNYGTVVTVTQSPGTGSTFTGWGGDCSGTGGCSVTMTQNRAVSAGYDLIPETLSVTNGGTGGTITSSPAGINCAGGAGTCTHDYGYGTLVTLTPVPDPGHQLALWAGACSGTPVTSPCTVTMNQAQSVTVRWLAQQFTFSLSFLGDSSGTVTVNGTQYTANTSFTVSYGQTLNLSETNSGNVFWGWGGACASQGTNSTCSLTVTGATSVSAEFDQSTYRYTLKAITASSNWFGFDVTYPPNVTSTAECSSAVSPGTNCAGSLPRGTTVNLKAHLSPLFPMVWHTLPTWTGCDSVSADSLTCTFTALSTRTITVTGDASQGP